MRPHRVLFVAIGVGIPDLIQPMRRPALAEVVGIEQAVDKRVIGGSGVDVCRARRQSRQVEERPAHQGIGRRFRRRLQALPLEPCEDERINRIADPVRVAHLGHCRPPIRAKRPMPWTRLGIRRLVGHSPLRTLGDPRTERVDILPRQWVAGRHSLKAVQAFKAFDQDTCGSVSRRDDGPGHAAPKGIVPAVQPQAALLQGLAVADYAVLPEQRLDIVCERHLRADRKTHQCRKRSQGQSLGSHGIIVHLPHRPIKSLTRSGRLARASLDPVLQAPGRPPASCLR